MIFFENIFNAGVKVQPIKDADGMAVKESEGKVQVFPETVAFYKEYVTEQYKNGSRPGMFKEPAISDELVAKAKDFADVAIVSISRFSGEGWDRGIDETDDIRTEYTMWPGEKEQRETYRDVFKTNDFYLTDEEKKVIDIAKSNFKKVVVVLNVGGVIDTNWTFEEGIDAVLMSWQGGMEGGLATADVLCGDVNPSGRLTASFPRNVGQIPVFYNHKNCGRPISSHSPYKRYTSSYMDVLNAPLYPFGYGLSYGKVNYGNLCLSADNAAIGTTVTVSVTLENPSEYDITETIQIYVRDNAASITRPVKELKAYKQVLVKAGETIVVELPLETSRLGFYCSDLNYVVEPGEFTIMAGPSSDSESLLKTKLTLK